MLEGQVDFSKFRVLIYRDFKPPGVNWSSGLVTSVTTLTINKASQFIYFIHFNGFSKQNWLKNSAGIVLVLFLSNCAIED